MTDMLKGLNPQQQKAVTASDGPVLVLAGPGSGKTRVLTHRVAWLVMERDVPPRQILAVTFTNKAAREMRERLQTLLGHTRAGELTLGTFHATCARILRRDGEAIGISRDYVIFDADDQETLVRQILRDLNIDDKKYRPATVLSAISRAKNDLASPATQTPSSYFDEVVRRVYGPYHERLRASNALDFDDLLGETVRLFHEQPAVLARYQERYRYILVDEFQDTNTAQYALLRQLSARYHNLFVVADEDQSIYLWRGADYRNISRLREDHPDLLTYLLEQNYRSTQNILDAARAVIRHNPNRTEKQLFTRRGEGLKLFVHEAYDQEEEAQFIVDTITELVAARKARPGDCAVMYRTNAQSRAIEDAFVRAGLPYRLVGATRFYARREVKDLLAFMRLAQNPADNASMSRVINVPPRAIGKQTVLVLEEAARSRGEAIWWAVEAVAEGRRDAPAVGSRAQTAVAAFHRLVRGWHDAREQMNASALMSRIVAETGYESYLRDGSEEGEDRWNNIRELHTVAAEYDELSLAEFLSSVALVSDVDGLSEEADAPTLLTLHSAKGLEFPVVFIAGLEEGLLPHSRSLDNPEALAEERRLMYVGVTRARDRLYLTHAFRRSYYGDYEPATPSRFLDDIPAHLTEGNYRRDHRAAARSQTTWTPATPACPPAATRFHTGDRVVHPLFGVGIVLESQPARDEEQVTVIFEKVGFKRILSSFLSLSKE